MQGVEDVRWALMKSSRGGRVAQRLKVACILCSTSLRIPSPRGLIGKGVIEVMVNVRFMLKKGVRMLF